MNRPQRRAEQFDRRWPAPLAVLGAFSALVWAGCSSAEYPKAPANPNVTQVARAARVVFDRPTKTGAAPGADQPKQPGDSTGNSTNPPTGNDPVDPDIDKPQDPQPEQVAKPDLRDESQMLTPKQAEAALEEMGARFKRDKSGAVTHVFLNRALVDDTALRGVGFIPTVQVVNLTGTDVRNDGLKHLKGLKNLKRIYVNNTQLGPEGLDDLKSALPDLKVMH